MSDSLEINADLRALRSIRHFVIERATGLGASQESADDMVYAVNELVTNAITHGYGGRAGPIWIDVWLEEDALCVRICDAAPAFDPLSVPLPRGLLPRDQRRPGGLGLFLTRQMIDDLRYRVLPDGGNELVLVKWQAA